MNADLNLSAAWVRHMRQSAKSGDFRLLGMAVLFPA